MGGITGINVARSKNENMWFTNDENAALRYFGACPKTQFSNLLILLN